MDYSEVSLQKHREWGGKIDYAAKMPIRSKEDLSIAYTPGVAKPCMRFSCVKLAADPETGGLPHFFSP